MRYTCYDIPDAHVGEAQRVVQLARAAASRPATEPTVKEFREALMTLDKAMRDATRVETKRRASELEKGEAKV